MEPDHGAVSRAWSWRHAIGKSGLQPITRLVLHTLSLKMDATGGSCYPSTAQLVELTGLDKKTILKHLDLAEQAGWITVSQHGFRGQKWKRNEYVARWPGRDMTGTAAGEGDEGGGAVPPPFDEAESAQGGGAVTPPPPSKVVEMVPEGGGNGSMKVVEQLHQDKNSPENSPIPLHSEGAAPTGRKMNRSKIKAAFISWFDAWPKSRTGSAEWAENAWFALSDEERAECVRLTPAYLRWVKVEDLPTTPQYLSQRRWDAIPDHVINPPEKTHGVAKPFGKLWMGVWLDAVSRDPDARWIRLTTYDERRIADGVVTRAELLRRKRIEHGWPVIAEMRDKHRRSEPFVTALNLLPAVAAFRPIQRDSDLWAEWQAFHESRDLPFPDRANDYVWMPVIEEGATDLADAVERAFAAFVEAASKVRGHDPA